MQTSLDQVVSQTGLIGLNVDGLKLHNLQNLIVPKLAKTIKIESGYYLMVELAFPSRN